MLTATVEGLAMSRQDTRPLTFETMLTDPLIRLVMDADGVSVPDLLAAMQGARQVLVARERLALMHALATVAVPATPSRGAGRVAARATTLNTGQPEDVPV
jgi:hypothetical protein